MNPMMDLALELDPALLMAAAGMQPDPWQATFLRSDAERTLLLCGRQTGKSTTTAVKALHKALYKPKSLTLLLSPALRQSGELFRKVIGHYEAIGCELGTKSQSALQVEFENGSRIVSLPGREETVRGYSGVDLIIVDEAARVPDELYFSVRPMLAVSRGQFIALSTPFGKDGWFADSWIGADLEPDEPDEEGGEGGWLRMKATAESCLRITPQFLKQERKTMGEWWYEQEYLCKFKDNVDTVFDSEAIDAAFSASVAPLFDPSVIQPITTDGLLDAAVEPLAGVN